MGKTSSPKASMNHFSCRRVSALLSRRYVLPHNFSRRRAKDRLRSPGCSKTVQQAAPKRYASERVCFCIPKVEIREILWAWKRKVIDEQQKRQEGRANFLPPYAAQR
jgi:hypothetical protein